MATEHEHNTIEGDTTLMMEGGAPNTKNNWPWLVAGCVALFCLCVPFLLWLGASASVLVANVFQTRQTTAVAQTQFVPTATALAQINATATAQAQWPIVVSDEFDSNDNDWLTTDVDNEYGAINQTIVNGKYRWEVEAQQGAIWIGLPSQVGDVSDFYLSTDMQQISGSDNTDYGVIFRRRDGNNFYFFGFNNVGIFTFALFYNGEWTSVINWRDGSAVELNNSNRIAVFAEGSHFVFYVNDHYIGEVDDDRLPRGRTGFMIEAYQAEAAVFEFDNFEQHAPLVSSQLAPAATAAGVMVEKSSEWPVVLHDTFDINLNDWQTGQSDNEYVKQSLAVSDGKYYWKATAHQNVHWWITPDTDSLSDFRLTADAELVEGIRNAQYGVIFRKVDSRNFYYFGITGAGQFAFWLVYKGEWTALIGWTDSSTIRRDEANQIRLIAEGSHFTFFINDHFIGETTDDNLSKGKAGLAMFLNNDGDEATFRFDNFELRAPAGPELPSPTSTRTPIPTRSGTANSSPTPQPTLALENLGYIAYYTERDLFFINADGADNTQLTNDIPLDSSPAWSPNGQQIAFSRRVGAQGDIFVINADGTDMKRITLVTSDDTDPAWSPGGKRIAFVSDRIGEQQDIYLMDVDGSNVTRLTTSPNDDFASAWSPDGKQLAFIARNNEQQEVYLINVDGSGQTQLTRDSTDNASPAWSPDSAKIAYASNRGGNLEIYVINTDGTGQIRLTTHPAKDIDPAWSSNAKYIAFTSSRDGNPEIYIMRADGSSPTRVVIQGSIDNLGPVWKP